MTGNSSNIFPLKSADKKIKARQGVITICTHQSCYFSLKLSLVMAVIPSISANVNLKDTPAVFPNAALKSATA
jgi:hypothetical protein